MKRVLAFAAVAAALTASSAAVMTVVWSTPAEERAIWLSAAIAFVVQMLAFGIITVMKRDQVIVGWGLGALMRLVTLSLYALVFVKALGLPSTAALVSLAMFFFLSTLVEPLLLAR